MLRSGHQAASRSMARYTIERAAILRDGRKSGLLRMSIV
jgi:hypothetical protein